MPGLARRAGMLRRMEACIGDTVGRGASIFTAADFLGVGFLGGIAGFTRQTLPTHTLLPSAPYCNGRRCRWASPRASTLGRRRSDMLHPALSTATTDPRLPSRPFVALRDSRSVPGGPRGRRAVDARRGTAAAAAGRQRERDPRLAARSQRAPPPGRACLPVPQDALCTCRAVIEGSRNSKGPALRP
jgi:hypothetical protein